MPSRKMSRRRSTRKSGSKKCGRGGSLSSIFATGLLPATLVAANTYYKPNYNRQFSKKRRFSRRFRKYRN